MHSNFKRRVSGIVLGCVATALMSPPVNAQDRHNTQGANVSQVAFSPGGEPLVVEAIRESIGQDRLFALDFEGQMGVAVGGNGAVMISMDGGASWETEQAPTQLALLGVSLSRGQIIAVGQQGLILLRDAQGRWSKAESGTSERLLNVDANAAGLAVAVGAFGTIIASDDGGLSWADAAPDWMGVAALAGRENDRTGAVNEPTMFAVQTFQDGTVLVAGELSYILRSGRMASGWELAYRASVSPGAVAPTVHSIDVRSDGVGFAVGQEGQVFKTSDHGKSWSVGGAPAGNGNLLSVSSTGTGMVLAVGMRVALRSSNDGRSWSVERGGDFAVNWYSDIEWVVQSQRLIAVGHSGRIISVE